VGKESGSLTFLFVLLVVEKKTIIYVQPEAPKTAEQIKQENYTRSQGSYQGALCVGC
jgi:hypothetical protein